MALKARIAEKSIPSIAPVLRQVNEMFAMGEAKLGPKAEHMEVVKILEELAGVTLKR